MDNEIIKISNLKENLKNITTCGNDNSRKLSVSKFFSGKYLKIIILIIILIVIAILYLSVKTESNEVDMANNSNTYYTSTLQYCEELELKLKNVLQQIDGIGNVSVMISVDGSPKYSLASNTDNKSSTTTNGTTTTTSSSPIIIDSVNGSNPLILTEELPKVKGVIVVATGASKIDVKLDILNAVSTLLDLSTDKISVLKGN